MILIYFIIGIIYCIVNGTIRNIDTDDDMLLPMVWIGFWPLCFIALIILYIQKKLNQHKL